MKQAKKQALSFYKISGTDKQSSFEAVEGAGFSVYLVSELADGKYAELSDTELPQAIIDDIKTGIGRTNGKYVEICDRKEAIKYAISHGEVGDVIVLAGKGHEDYQEIKGKKYPMDERDLIRDILAGK